MATTTNTAAVNENDYKGTCPCCGTPIIAERDYRESGQPLYWNCISGMTGECRRRRELIPGR